MALTKVYRRIGYLLPRPYRATISRILTYSGKRTVDAQVLLGETTVFSILVGLIIVLAPLMLRIPFTPWFYLFSVGAILAIHYLNYLILFIGLEDYSKRIEEVLPDFLRLTASNIRSGMTPFQALRLSARPEFGPLKDEVEYVTVRGLGTEDFSELLKNINKHIQSENLDRVLRLFTSTIKSGGKLAQVLEESSADIEEKRRLRKELNTVTKSYSIFIMFAVIILAPFLLSISIQFLTMVTSLSALTKSADALGGFGGTISITVDFLRICAMVFLFMTGILASVLTAVIKQEKLQYGFKYAIVIIGASFIAFFGAQAVIKGMFGAQ